MNVTEHAGPDSLDTFSEECEKSLLSGVIYQFKYPDGTSLSNWSAEEIKKNNKQFLDNLRNRGNVYALWVRESEQEEWVAVYVGQRKSKNLRERLTQHLLKKNKKTGSMLASVKTAVGAGKQIGVSFIKVHPESLRLFVEETIIARRKADLPWNTHV